MILGFTGTRDGLTTKQAASLIAWLADNGPYKAAHHGDCVGGDSHFHSAVRNLCWHTPIHIRPCDLDKYRAGRDADVLYRVKDPLSRNHDIVSSASVLLACPKGPEERKGSGTWSTIRYAKKIGVPVIIFWPDGRVEGSHVRSV